MKKYFIVLILGLLIGMLFAKSVYGQENYFTPMTALQASSESSESKKDNSESSEIKALSAQDATYEISYYYEQYTYPYYIESGDFFETKYALALRNVKYSDVEFTLTYLQPYIVYDDSYNTTMYILVLLDCIKQNIEGVSETITYCRLMGYEDEIIQSLISFVDVMSNQYSCIQDYALKYLDAYKKEDFASCIKYILQIENKYWDLYVKISSVENYTGTNKITIIYNQVDE